MIYITVYGTDVDFWVGPHHAYDDFVDALASAAEVASVSEPCLDALKLLTDAPEWMDINDAELLCDGLKELAPFVPSEHATSVDRALRACREAMLELRPIRVWP